MINSLQNNKLLDWSKLKAFAYDKINVTEKLKFVQRRVENIVGKGQNAGKEFSKIYIRYKTFLYERVQLFEILYLYYSIKKFPNNPTSQQTWGLIACMVFNAISTLFQLYRCVQYTYLCFPGVLFISVSQNILYELLATFLDNHCRNSRQRQERNESCPNDYHQSSE